MAEVLDAFGGFAVLQRRSPTLGGSVPLRVAQGCVPLLEGNAFGMQVVLQREIRLRKRLGRWQVAEDAALAELERARRVALPILRARGLVDGWRELERGVVDVDRGVIRIWTGLCVRPPEGAWLWLQSAANRRNVHFELRERVIVDPEAWVPLVLEVRPAAGVRELRLIGEVGCLALLRPGATVRERSCPDVLERHLAFYEQAYFEAKKQGAITKRYRRLVDGSAVPAGATMDTDVVRIGPAPGGVEAFADCLLADGPAPAVPERFGRAKRYRFDALIDFEVSWDGHRVAVDYDRERLRRLASEVGAAFGPEAERTHRGAILYMTKYFTPHPPGEPHFFLKPWALTRTSVGCSSVLDGHHGPGFDVMRGVVHTDQFHATPAVFTLRAPRVDVAAGQPLLRVTPVPRTLLEADLSVQRLEGVEPIR